MRINKGVKDNKDDGTPIYDYVHLYASTELELREKIKAYYDEIEEKKESKEIFEKDIFEWLRLNYWGYDEKRTQRIQQLYRSRYQKRI